VALKDDFVLSCNCTVFAGRSGEILRIDWGSDAR
jgi:hypothetical protein